MSEHSTNNKVQQGFIPVYMQANVKSDNVANKDQQAGIDITKSLMEQRLVGLK